MNLGLINRRDLAVVAAVLATAAGSALAGGDRGGGHAGSGHGGGHYYGGGYGGGGVRVGVNIGGGYRSGYYGGSGLSLGYRGSHFGIGFSVPLGSYYRSSYCAPRDGYYSSGYYYRPEYSAVVAAPLYVAPVYDVPTYTTPYTVVSRTAPVIAYPSGTQTTGAQQPNANGTQPVYVQQSTTVNTLPQAANPASGPEFAASPAPIVDANPPSDFERGLAALQTKEPRDAVAALKAHVRVHGDDANAERLLGIALLNVGQPAEAAASVRHAYKTDLTLAREVVSPSALGYTEREYRDLVSRAVIQGNRDNTASSWLFVSVLMQGEGRSDLARNMLDRAQKAGLEPDVYNAMAAELPQK